MKSVLAIDYGEKRMGLAASDLERKFSFEIGTWLNDKNFFAKLRDLAREREADTIVLGFPLNLSGQETRKSGEVLEFRSRLEREFPEMKIELADERLSSKMAEKISGRNKNIDGLAAQIFLEAYLKRNRQEPEAADLK